MFRFVEWQPCELVTEKYTDRTIDVIYSVCLHLYTCDSDLQCLCPFVYMWLRFTVPVSICIHVTQIYSACLNLYTCDSDLQCLSSFVHVTQIYSACFHLYTCDSDLQCLFSFVYMWLRFTVPVFICIHLTQICSACLHLYTCDSYLQRLSSFVYMSLRHLYSASVTRGCFFIFSVYTAPK